MGAVVLLRLLDQMHLSECPFRDQLLETNILGCETQLFGIAEDDAGPLASGDHPVAFGEIQRHRLFDDDVFAGFGRQAGDFAMQVIGDAQDDQVNFLEVEQPAKIGEVMRDSSLRGELLGTAGRRRCDGDTSLPRTLRKAS